jgi:hypothetical protein
MKSIPLVSALFGISLISFSAWADVDVLLQRGEEIYTQPASCGTCHGLQGEGGVGPTLSHGPTPYDVDEQFKTNPQMGPLAEILNPTPEDLVAVALYIRTLYGLEVNDEEEAKLRSTLASIPVFQSPENFPLTERDKAMMEIESFASVLEDWPRRAKEGSIKSTYEIKVAQEWDPEPAVFEPQPGKTYFYQNTGAQAAIYANPMNKGTASTSRVVLGDAETLEIIDHYELPVSLKSSVHTTVATADGKSIYIIGSKPYSGADLRPSITSPATLLKVNAMTLRPEKQYIIGGRLHHAQLFQDRYILMDTFSRDADGLDVFLFDPETETIVGGVRDEDLGGASYTSFHDDEFIYILMQPAGYGPPSMSGYVGASRMNEGEFIAMRPFWVAKLDPRTWEVVKEYPYPGYRGNWIVVDSKSEFMYVPAGGSSTLHKINIETGEVVWTQSTGIGPYGATLNADETRIWVADKGETTGMYGRTITVIDTATGKHIDTVFSAYTVDHVLLSPTGKEIWATSNGEGAIYVFDAATRERKSIIPMPAGGQAHGLVWVHYDEDGNSRTVRDQGGFHNGINPANGVTLDY